MDETMARAVADYPRLHLGCGFNFVPGWLNVGLFDESYLPYGRTKFDDGLVLHVDVTRDFPFADGSLEAVYASHFIEHFTLEDGLSMLRKLRLALCEGGVLRLTFPDLGLWARKYVENDAAFFEKYRSFFLDHPSVVARTRGEIFMSQVHGFGHRWSYDFESMAHVLGLAGFAAVERKAPFESALADIRRLESGWEGRTMETCYVEARR